MAVQLDSSFARQLKEEEHVEGEEVHTMPDDDLGGVIDDDVCAVCLDSIPAADLAIVKGCEHTYCVCCILQWAHCKEVALCPQCKSPFHYLYVHRMLDGTLSDYPLEESVCLLKRARWFEEHVKAKLHGKALGASDFDMRDFGDALEEEEDYRDEEDEEFENYYFSSAAGHARVVLGNRRMGENGYMRAGRIYGRPVNNTPPPPTTNSKKSGSKGIGKPGQRNPSKASDPGAGGSRSTARSVDPTASSGSNNGVKHGQHPSKTSSGAGSSSTAGVDLTAGSRSNGGAGHGGSITMPPAVDVPGVEKEAGVGGTDSLVLGSSPPSGCVVGEGSSIANGGAGGSTTASAKKNQGRRAKRAPRRAAVDDNYDEYDEYNY